MEKRMSVRIQERFMLLPVSATARPKKLLLKKEGRLCVELDLRLSASPDFLMPYDLRDYVGDEMTLETEPACDFRPVFAAQAPQSGLYGEKYRPAAHFTAAAGWINDPNGFVYYEGLYHLFFQHNPADTVWGNMHWGHAVSRDLVHWEQQEETLFPDETGTMYSGSAVVDARNLTGLRENDHAPLLLFYTAAGGNGLMNQGRAYTQRLAYSVDGGKTFVKYGKPILENIAPGNRDPKIIFCEELNAYVMALYLRGREFMLLKSCDLLNWTEMQRLSLEEDDECPDFYPLEAEGRRYWVLTAAHDRYLVGEMRGGAFVPVHSPGRLHYGAQSYAAQTCFGAPDGRRIRLAWNRSPIPAMPFNGSMTTPHDMTLRPMDGSLRLCAWPSREFEALRGACACADDHLTLTGAANDIEFSVPAEGVFTARLFGFDLTIDARSMTAGLPDPAKDGRMPVRAENGRIALRVIQDRHSIEVYAGHGEAMLCFAHVSDSLLNEFECPGARIAAWPLEGIWREQK